MSHQVPSAGHANRVPCCPAVCPHANLAVAEIVGALEVASDSERAAQEKRYLRGDLDHLGASVPAIRNVVTDFTRCQSELSRDDLLIIAEELWAEPVHERRMAALELLVAYQCRLEPADLVLVEQLIRESRTWALVDGLAIRVAGALVERFPELAVTLDVWATDADFWVRRSALLALLRPLRRGEGDFDRFAGYADTMLDEREFFIRKAIGWVLRETAKERPQMVAEWLRPRAARASGVTVREAVKYLPDDEWREILAAKR